MTFLPFWYEFEDIQQINIFKSYIKFQVHSYKEQSTIQAFKL